MTFRNEPLLELRRPWVRDGLRNALAALDRELPLPVPVLVAGSARAGATFASTDPGDPARVVAHATQATEADVEAAIAAAREAQPAWAARTGADRAGVLVAAAALLRARRPRLTALAVRESAKPWAEADGDVCEAIDFLEFYAQEAVALDRGADVQSLPGERNRMVFRARGIAAVVAPWNFPLAIPMGMTAAALVTGNAALLKPAEQSPACASELVRALHEAGVPPGVLALLPGAGDVGAALVRHPAVATIAFTGSSAVGQEILRTAGDVRPGQHDVKQVVAEMGGKNCIIVDADADLDEAVPAIAYSAFGFAGQKCSACSRVLVHDALAGPLVERLTGLLDTLVVDQAERFGADVGPVIEPASVQRLEGHLARAAAAGAAVARGAAGPPGDGLFVAPAVVTGAGREAPIAREELFGPVVVVEGVPDLDTAVGILDGLPYGLTAGLFARNPDTVAAVAPRLPVGNVYVNRHITGAMVGRQPFGGTRLSGTGTKAGGPGYLLQFVTSLVVCENTLRHGLVV